MKNQKLIKIKRVLNFIESDLKVNLQLSLLDQPKNDEQEQKQINQFRISFSKDHNTNVLICKDYYKKTF